MGRLAECFLQRCALTINQAEPALRLRQHCRTGKRVVLPLFTLQASSIQALSLLKRSFRKLPLLVLVVTASGCGENDILANDIFVTVLQEHIVEHFSVACDSDKCKEDLDSYTAECFDRDFTRETLDGETPEYRRRRTKDQVRSFQACLAARSGVDYWAQYDMPAYIVDREYADEG